MMINRTFEHMHHNVSMISSLLIVNALYPNVALGFPLFLKQNSILFPVFFKDFQPISWIRLNNKIKIFFIELDGKYLNSNTAKVFL